MMSNYVGSSTRTNKLYCSDVIFKLDHGSMEDMCCEKCKKTI